MKLPQMIVLVFVVAAVVFAVTYLKMGIGDAGTAGTDGPPPPVPAGARLTFPVRVAPPSGIDEEARMESELGVPGHHDFWFRNDESQAVQVGLKQMSCKCSQVELALATDASPAGSPAPQPGPSADWKKLEEGDKGVSVPAGAGGWVRVRWTGNELGPQRLGVALWSGNPQTGPEDRLEVSVIFLEAVSLDAREKDIGRVSPGDPQKEVDFFLWSSTRQSFQVEPQPVKDREGKPDRFVTVGAPVPLTPEERQAISKRISLPVQCGYTVRVSVRERTDDAQIDLGPLLRQVDLKLKLGPGANGAEPAEAEALRVRVGGWVPGEVTVGSEKDQGRILLGIFRADYGINRPVRLEAQQPNLQLTLEKDKIPEYLDVKLTEEKSGPRKVWRLDVRVPPNRVVGQFPREDDPRYRDSAVYLKTQAGRRIRIPVGGTATP